MGPGTINDVLGAIATQVTTAITKLVPVGQALTGSFVALSILMLGAALVSGGSSFIAPIVRMTAAAAGTFWAISHWPEITTGTLQGARAAIGLLTGGYDGPATLFQMANDVSARVFTETNGLSMWSISTYIEAIVSGLAGILIWLGLSVTGLLAILAEFQLLIGAAVAPLILPALAFGFTTPIGWGAVTFMVSAGVRVVVMGTVSYVMSSAVTSVITVPGTDVPLTYEQMVTLLGVALLTALVGFCCNSIARDLVSGSPGSLGWGSVVRTGGTVGAAIGLGAPAARGAVTTMATLSRGAGALANGAVSGGGRMARGSGAEATGSSGSAGANAGSTGAGGSQTASTAAIPRSSGTGSAFD
jgi:hypothetical protein